MIDRARHRDLKGLSGGGRWVGLLLRNVKLDSGGPGLGITGHRVSGVARAQTDAASVWGDAMVTSLHQMRVHFDVKLLTPKAPKLRRLTHLRGVRKDTRTKTLWSDLK